MPECLATGEDAPPKLVEGGRGWPLPVRECPFGERVWESLMVLVTCTGGALKGAFDFLHVRGWPASAGGGRSTRA